jgi:FlaA1/EpsC-like NDP-sugar epimerase
MRNRHFLLVDLVLLGLLPFAVLALRLETFDFDTTTSETVLTYAALALPLRIAIMYGSGVYRFLWRYASLVELERLLYAGAVSGIVTFLLGAVILPGLGLTPIRMPLSALAFDAVATFGMIAAPRLAVRLLWARGATRAAGAKRAVIVGAGALGQAVLREAQANPAVHMEPVAFVDDDTSKTGLLLGGVPVEGTIGEIEAVIKKHGADEVIIAIPSPKGAVVRRIFNGAGAAGVTTRIVPGMNDLISGRVSVQALRKVEIQDLLRREPIETDMAAVKSLAAGQVVLVTGAGGSIGSELCRQIAPLEPSALVLLDHSENSVFEIDNELRKAFPGLRIVPLIADIRDTARIRSSFEAIKPYAVFHAAAHKHVPLMEGNAAEAVTNNILGTRNVVDAALDNGVDHLVFISTDKAVRPTSVMGATKRIAEDLIRHAAAIEGKNFVAVRFGNVLGSRGSVIPTFVKQIEEGGPVTVTHPEMKRYFMTIPEAVQLVLQAAAMGTGGELFVLDMGEQVKIVDLARDLIRLSGLEEGTDIEISYTGIRPGEKLYEEVFFGHEEVSTTSHPKVLRALVSVPDAGVPAAVDSIINRVQSERLNESEIRAALHALVPDYTRPDANPPKHRSSPHAATAADIKSILR